MSEIRLQFIVALLSYHFKFMTYGSAPISDFESSTIPAWYPYNLIETDVSCYKVIGDNGGPLCPMFPPGGRLSVFPNSQEKFQHALHNMHRMHKNPNLTAIQNVDITRWWGEGLSKLTTYYSAHITTYSQYCSTFSTTRHPLYWYSDANAAARLKAWDQSTCSYVGLEHNLCDNANVETIWSSTGNINITTNRCSIFGGCLFDDRASDLSVEDDITKGENPWFAEENICGGNSCFNDSQCDPIFATYNDYVGYGFVEGMNGVTHQYSRFTYEISYELPIGMYVILYDHEVSVLPCQTNITCTK